MINRILLLLLLGCSVKAWKSENSAKNANFKKYLTMLRDQTEFIAHWQEKFDNYTQNAIEYCNMTKWRLEANEPYNEGEDDVCGDPPVTVFPWCVDTTSWWYDHYCVMGPDIVGQTLCGPYEANETNPPEPFRSMGIQQCDRGGEHTFDEHKDNPLNKDPLDLLHLNDWQSEGKTFLSIYDAWNDATYTDAPLYNTWNLYGNLSIEGNASWFIYHPVSYGNFRLSVNSGHVAVIVDVDSRSVHPYKSSFESGGTSEFSLSLLIYRSYSLIPLTPHTDVVLFGGKSYEGGMVKFTTHDSIQIVDMENHGTSEFFNSQDIFMADTINYESGDVSFHDVDVIMVETTNHGRVTIGNGGKYRLLRSSNEATGEIYINGTDLDVELLDSKYNKGSIIVSGTGNFVISSGSNEGTVDSSDCVACSVNATIVANKGSITIGEGVTGTLTILGTSSGTINVLPTSGFELIEKNFGSKKLSQSLTLSGLCADKITEDVQIAISYALADVLEIDPLLIFVKDVTGSSCEGGSGRFRRRLSTDSASVNYDVYFEESTTSFETTKTAMSTISSNAGSILTATQKSLGDSTSFTITTNTPEEATFTGYGLTQDDGGNDDDGSSSDDNILMIVGISIGVLAVIVLGAVYFSFCRVKK